MFSFSLWIVVLVAVVAGAQWQLAGRQLAGRNSKIDTQVLGAQANKPDTTPPTVSISFPAAGGVYGPASWAGSVSGSAADAAGVAKVEVRLGGGSWTVATGTTRWSSPLALPAPGSYAVSVRATDGATPSANTSNPVTVTFQVDTQGPAAPTISAKPDNPSFDTKPHFAYSDSEAGVTFQCQLDSGAVLGCGSSVDYSKLTFGDHTFTVWAFDGAGNRSPGTTYGWTFLENMAFGITDAGAGSTFPRQPLYPGGSSPLDLKLSNPYNFTIRVTGITVTATAAVKATHQDPQCSVATDVSTSGLITHNPATAPTVDIPANSSRMLSSYLTGSQAWPADWPTITMANTTSNQDDCKNTTFTLSYTGTATK
jgi:hypothetical protein